MNMKNKMKEKENENEDLNLALPHDLIVEILLRLPVRSLVRLKCVSTSWLSLISNPHFAKSHFDLAASPTHRLLLKRINDGSEIESLDFEASLHEDSAVVNLKFPPCRARNFLTLGSCRGFILLTKKKGLSIGDLIVWNPSTGAHREIPVTYGYDNWDSWYDSSTRVRQGIPPHHLSSLLNGFGYDASKDDYLLVVIRLGVFYFEVFHYGVRMKYSGPKEIKSSRPRIEVLSVKTNVPSFIYGDEVEYSELGPESMPGVFFNQSWHWLVMSSATHLHVVIAFDLVERSLSEIPLSGDLAVELEPIENCYLRVLGGCLSVCYSGEYDSHEMVVWVMKEYKVQSSWTKSFVLSAHDMDFLPICFTPCGGVFGSDESGMFKKFNVEGELIENRTFELEYNGALKYFDMYRESLLTLPIPDDAAEEEDEDA